ncbi:MAG: hypothetical protein H6898_05260 [Rhodobacter sp.]|nr:hypothetical protein [Paracoccaceae bacterium]MCC0075980.1 hypothetical protein [Rhodobacter sp.]
MPLTQEHELHKRRWGRNLGLGLTLGAFIALVFGLTIAKVQQGSQMQGFDHTYRIEMDPDARIPGANR